MPVDATETALVVTVPEAEDAVGAYRSRLDPAAAWGVPAHITVLYPFAPPVRVAAVLPAIEDAVRSVRAFDFTLARTARSPRPSSGSSPSTRRTAVSSPRSCRT